MIMLQCLLHNLHSKARIPFLLVENHIVPALPNIPYCYRKYNFPRGLGSTKIAHHPTIKRQPTLKVTPPKNHDSKRRFLADSTHISADCNPLTHVEWF